jgi:hypothetical protein
MRQRQIEIDGIEFPLKPTPLIELTELMPGLSKGINTPEGSRALADALYHGIRRAKGDITIEWIRQAVDMHNANDLFRALCELNKLTPTAVTEEGTASGEGEAGATS